MLGRNWGLQIKVGGLSGRWETNITPLNSGNNRNNGEVIQTTINDRATYEMDDQGCPNPRPV
jgi:hypothetical protein